MTPSTMSAFTDELAKIKQAGELQGFTRSGRRPISVDRLLEREAEIEAENQELFEKVSKIGKKMMGGVGFGAGLGAMYLGSKMNRDRQTGRQMRIQSQMGY